VPTLAARLFFGYIPSDRSVRWSFVQWSDRRRPVFFFEKKKKKEGRGQWTRTRAGTTKPAGQRRCVVHVLVPILSSLSDR
jgi:hypothetical protein